MKKRKRRLLNGWCNMPIADTELLFLLSPKDPRYKFALKTISELKGKLHVPECCSFRIRNNP